MGTELEPLGASWVVSGALFSCLYLEWSSKALLEASGRDFDAIFARFWEVWEGSWLHFEGFGRGLGRVWASFFRKPARIQVHRQFHMNGTDFKREL